MHILGLLPFNGSTENQMVLCDKLLVVRCSPERACIPCITFDGSHMG